MSEFMPGLALSRRFYADVVRGLIGPRVHGAALLGAGSEVLGFDTARSTDHGWGPRLQVFVGGEDREPVRAAIEAGLPAHFLGWSTTFGWDEVEPTHHVDVTDLGTWVIGELGFDPRDEVTAIDRLVTPQQLLLGVTSGAVFHDGLGELGRLRELLAWYPDDVWRRLVACQWRRIEQEEPFVGRGREVGDDLGSRVITARLARELVHLCFLLERRYAPYEKWLGSAFARLNRAGDVGTALSRTLSAASASDREEALVNALEAAARLHNATGLTDPIDPQARMFHARPFRVIGADRSVGACLSRVEDPWLRSLPLVGGIDRATDSTERRSTRGRGSFARSTPSSEPAAG